ncbi:MAG: hypothetical protein IJW11_07495 [Clostridia bacterium]|nr:hypothetical protein [Clostridia bacterium]MBQ7407579.1 hypothetical protein [Clostridia bacterium]
MMLENRNNNSALSASGKGTVCIDTQRVLDSCRDRDCFENTRVYLTASGEEILQNTANIRTRSVRLLWAYVGVDDVPFNCGFYRITVRYYVQLELEGCIGGRTQSFRGISIFEKDVVLYGGEGRVTTFSSSPENSACNIADIDTRSSNAPVAIVETVEPLVLGTRVDCECACPCDGCPAPIPEIPDAIATDLDGPLVNNPTGPKIFVSFGIFSIIRIVRPTQILVQATDYSVPEKECVCGTNDENPCALFRTIAFPVQQFRGDTCPSGEPAQIARNGCGCGKS